jgi:hypothetical protein
MIMHELIEIVSRLATVRATLGEDTYRDAVRRALVGVGLAVRDEAERRAGVRGGPDGIVIRFPLGRPDRNEHD